jgi:4,5-DOPA dioxygenase extradiol
MPTIRTDAMTRRDALKAIAAAGGAFAVAGSCAPVGETKTASAHAVSPDLAPAIFLAHGSPPLLDDAVWVAELARWARDLPRPKSVLMISAHWTQAPVTLGATRTVPLVYDFYGFPQRYYDVKYAAPGAPDLARRVRELLDGKVADDPDRGLDHGAYVPLVAMYPAADVPVLQISIPTMEPAPLLELGRRLAPLRREGVLLVGSGFLTHNLREFGSGEDATPPAWASEFDAWTADALARRDADALADYRARAPGVRMALPTHEHFVPVLVALGASLDAPDEVTFPITGFTYGSFTKRSVQFG